MSIIPLITEPVSLNSYTSLTTELIFINQQLKTPLSSIFIEQTIPLQELNIKIENLNNCFKEKIEIKTDFIKAFHEKKLIERMNEEFYDISNELKDAIKEIKEEKLMEFNINEKINFKNIEKLEKEIEESEKNILKDKPQRKLFSNNFIYDSYCYMSKDISANEFLNLQYKMHIENVLQKKEINVKEFTQLKYGNEDFNVEIYQGRFLYAELYVYYRIGDFDGVFNLLNEFSFFFSRFREYFINFLKNQINYSVNDDSDDKFKKILIKIINNEKECDVSILNTFEDWLWYQFMTKTDFYHQLNNVGNESAKIFGFLLSEKYENVIDLIIENKFNAYECFYLLGEILNKKKSGKKVEVIFLHLIFTICKVFKKDENKIKLLNICKDKIPNDFYNKNIARFIVNYELYSILKIANFDHSIMEKLCDILLQKKDRKKILNFYSLFDKITIENLVCEELKDNIMIEKNLKIDDIAFYKNIINDIKSIKGNVLFDLLSFDILKNFESLKKTIFCIHNLYFDKDIKVACEKLIFIACKTAMENKCKDVGGLLFYFLERLELTKEDSVYVNKELLSFI
ncbi:hypothetical protein GVAV_003383 [Gurleya vavrai]